MCICHHPAQFPECTDRKNMTPSSADGSGYHELTGPGRRQVEFADASIDRRITLLAALFIVPFHAVAQGMSDPIQTMIEAFVGLGQGAGQAGRAGIFV